MITLISVPGTGGALMFEDDPGPILTDPALLARGQFLGPAQGLNWNYFSVTYPAAVFPMGPSWRQGIEEVVYVLRNYFPQGLFVLDGYSQGAIITSHVWRDEILNPAGRLHNRLNDCLGVIEYGPPCRAPGVAYGNTLLWGRPVPQPLDGFTTGGIAGPDDLTPEQCLFPQGHPLAGQPAVYCHANDGDLYGAAPVGDNPWAAESGVGHDETLIYNVIQDFDGKNILALVEQLMGVLGVVSTGFNLGTLISVVAATIEGAIGVGGIPGIPGTGVTSPDQIVSIVEALLNGGMFVLQGAGPHGAYDSGPAIAFLQNLGAQYALS